MLFSRLARIVLALLVMTLPSHAEAITLSGTVTYRERIAMPQNAQLNVRLVSLPSGTRVAGASASIPAKGQVPLQFSLNLRNGVTRPADSYGLVADISVGGRVMFTNFVPVPVDLAAGASTDILVHFVSEPPAPVIPPVVERPLLDQVWQVTSIGAKPVIGARPVTLSIAADLRTNGHAGCNSYFTEATLHGNQLSFGPSAATKMACAPELMAQESALFAALAAVAAFELDASGLRLLDASGVPLVGLVRQKE